MAWYPPVKKENERGSDDWWRNTKLRNYSEEKRFRMEEPFPNHYLPRSTMCNEDGILWTCTKYIPTTSTYFEDSMPRHSTSRLTSVLLAKFLHTSPHILSILRKQRCSNIKSLRLSFNLNDHLSEPESNTDLTTVAYTWSLIDNRSHVINTNAINQWMSIEPFSHEKTFHPTYHHLVTQLPK